MKGMKRILNVVNTIKNYFGEIKYNRQMIYTSFPKDCSNGSNFMSVKFFFRDE